MATAQEKETLATFLNRAEDRLYREFEQLPEELRPCVVGEVMKDKEKIEQKFKDYTKSDPAMARAGGEEIAEYLQEASSFISTYG